MFLMNFVLNFTGLKNFLRDVEFMLGIRLGIYWKFTWGVFIPLSLMGIFIYSLANFRTFVTEGYIYPASLTGSGWVLAALALLQVPIWAGLAIYKRKGSLLDVSLFHFICLFWLD
jgi:solute carrier family 6 amino acid transporter-like protein 5/7/9/14